MVSRKGIARTFQLTALFDQLRVVDNLALGYQKMTKHGFWDTIFHTARWQREREQMQNKIMEVLSFIGLERRAFDLVSTISQGEQRLLAIGIALMSNPKLILLDEPTGAASGRHGSNHASH